MPDDEVAHLPLVDVAPELLQLRRLVAAHEPADRHHRSPGLELQVAGSVRADRRRRPPVVGRGQHGVQGRGGGRAEVRAAVVPARTRRRDRATGGALRDGRHGVGRGCGQTQHHRGHRQPGAQPPRPAGPQRQTHRHRQGSGQQHPAQPGQPVRGAAQQHEGRRPGGSQHRGQHQARAQTCSATP